MSRLVRGLGRRLREVLVGGLILAGCTSPGTSSPETPEPTPEPTTSTAEPTPEPTAEEPGTALPSSTVECPAEPTVTTTDELVESLDAVEPGETIVLAPGTYDGLFVATTSGTAEEPITLCGPVDAVLDGGGTEGGYVVHLDGASHWRLGGFTVTNGQKGVMADGTVGSVVSGLTVTSIGDEAIHLRKASTDNVVSGNVISDTGLRKPKFGEGVYIGTAESNWCDITACEPDPSDRNVVELNTISGTTSESIDIKEGTSDGIVRGNTFDGSSISAADSWVDVKGNGWLVEGNTGTSSPTDGFQTHEILEGWGDRNVFRANVADVGGSGFGYSLTPELSNVVECDNTATDAAEGLTNVECVTP